jgi:arylformamidase
VPPTIVKGGLCISGMYELTPVRLSWRRSYVNFTDAMVDSMSSQRHIDKIVAPVTVAYGSLETPDFQRQNRDFAAALKEAGKPVQLIEGKNYTHSAMCAASTKPSVGEVSLIRPGTWNEAKAWDGSPGNLRDPNPSVIPMVQLAAPL